MEKATPPKGNFVDKDETLRQMYEKVVGLNCSSIKKSFITCPECGEEILITPTLSEMNEAIEIHVQLHKARIEPNLLLKYSKPINIRLALAKQILHEI
jgi:uncharacterized protein with PIN domain